MFWENDLPMVSSLLAELRSWRLHWLSQEYHPEGAIESLKSADEDVFPNIRQLLTIAVTLPVTSTEAERTFSGLKRLKMHLRSTMGQERLTGLTLIHLNQDKKIVSDEIVHKYVKKHRRRMFEKCILYQ
ncbi:52 kDa repressor of the inhibitor of the protein kinase-like [Haliotis rubra]|uniref:52 kDa repressor of the inhibitor of the protein kinase-like n=1 Tax=Haliotis rubra TaxID=36100 RepID=UPI001EE518ED|nr:52 kDa repressor of the inhibitor of the protein kinase-like [Haliotis rubra]